MTNFLVLVDDIPVKMAASFSLEAETEEEARNQVLEALSSRLEHVDMLDVRFLESEKEDLTILGLELVGTGLSEDIMITVEKVE